MCCLEKLIKKVTPKTFHDVAVHDDLDKADRWITPPSRSVEALFPGVKSPLQSLLNRREFFFFHSKGTMMLEFKLMVTEDEMNLMKVVIEEFLRKHQLPLDPYSPAYENQKFITKKLSAHYKRVNMSGLEEEITRQMLITRFLHKFLRESDTIIS